MGRVTFAIKDLSWSVSISRNKENEERRLAKKQRRQRQEITFYRLIKRQLILTALVLLTTLLMFCIQFYDRGTTTTVLGYLANVIFVYMSFNFNIKCYVFTCGRWSEDC